MFLLDMMDLSFIVLFVESFFISVVFRLPVVVVAKLFSLQFALLTYVPHVIVLAVEDLQPLTLECQLHSSTLYSGYSRSLIQHFNGLSVALLRSTESTFRIAMQPRSRYSATSSAAPPITLDVEELQFTKAFLPFR